MKKQFKKPQLAVVNAEAANIICGSGGEISSIKPGSGDYQPVIPEARQHGAGAAAIGNNPVSTTQLLDF